MKVYAILSVVLLGLVSGVHGVEFDCSSMQPADDGLTVADTEAPFGFTITPTSVQAGGNVTVHLVSTDRSLTFSSFLVAAHNMLQSMTPVGTWVVDVNDTLARTRDCLGNEQAVLYQASYDPKTSITATWVAPQNLLSNIELMASVSISNRTVWVGFNSVKISREIPDQIVPVQPEVEVEGNEEDDAHSDVKESEQALAAEMKKQEMIDEEVRYSEGDWQKQEVEAEMAHQQMMQWELQQYELQVQQEEQRRQEGIRAEIMDQEEHEVVDTQTEREEVEEQLEEEVEEILEGDGILSDDNVIELDHFLGEKVGGSSHQVASLVVVLAAAILAAIL